MFKPVLKTLLVGMAFTSFSSVANTPRDPVYFESGQYTASLAQDAQRWHLQPLTGDVVDVIDRTCANPLRLPDGVWLVTRDDAGRLQLVAPSTTKIPDGFPTQLRLAACGSGDARGTVVVPDIVLAWLAGNSGAVLIHE